MSQWKNVENMIFIVYPRVDFIPPNFPGCTESIENMPYFTAREMFYMFKVNDKDLPVLLCPDQKRMALMKTFV